MRTSPLRRHSRPICRRRSGRPPHDLRVDREVDPQRDGEADHEADHPRRRQSGREAVSPDEKQMDQAQGYRRGPERGERHGERRDLELLELRVEGAIPPEGVLNEPGTEDGTGEQARRQEQSTANYRQEHNASAALILFGDLLEAPGPRGRVLLFGDHATPPRSFLVVDIYSM